MAEVVAQEEEPLTLTQIGNIRKKTPWQRQKWGELQRYICIWILTYSLLSCITLGKLSNLSKLGLFYLCNGSNHVYSMELISNNISMYQPYS